MYLNVHVDANSYILILFQLWLIEVNVNPALHTNCSALERLLPGLVEETLGTLHMIRMTCLLSYKCTCVLEIAYEVCSKSRRCRPIFPIEALSNYENVFPQ